MFIFKMLDFGFRLLASVIFVLMLQISVGGRTLEDYLMSFIHRSDSLAPVRDIAYSSVRRINPNVQIKSAEERAPASVPPSAKSPAGLSENMLGDILKIVLSQYQNIFKNVLRSSENSETSPLSSEEMTKAFPSEKKTQGASEAAKSEEPATVDLQEETQ